MTPREVHYIPTLDVYGVVHAWLYDAIDWSYNPPRHRLHGTRTLWVCSDGFSGSIAPQGTQITCLVCIARSTTLEAK